MSFKANQSVYTISKESDYLAKKSRYENKINGKIIMMPLHAPYIRSSFDVNIFLKYISTFNYSYNLNGVVVPVDRSYDLLSKFPITFKNSSLMMIDPLPEVFYFGSLKPEIYRRYSRIKGLPQEVIKILQTPNKTRIYSAF